jgi:hypothetical protein
MTMTITDQSNCNTSKCSNLRRGVGQSRASLRDNSLQTIPRVRVGHYAIYYIANETKFFCSQLQNGDLGRELGSALVSERRTLGLTVAQKTVPMFGCFEEIDVV